LDQCLPCFFALILGIEEVVSPPLAQELVQQIVHIGNLIASASVFSLGGKASGFWPFLVPVSQEIVTIPLQGTTYKFGPGHSPRKDIT